MSIHLFLIAFFLIRISRRSLQTADKLPKWDQFFIGARWFAIILLLTELFLPFDDITKWLWKLFLLVLISSLLYFRKSRPVQAILLAVVPFILITLFHEIFKQFASDYYKFYESYYASAEVFSIIWMFAVLINYNKQHKALEKERLKREAEEEEKRLIARHNMELENMVAERTAELTRQAAELQQTLHELKTTQTHLIQREKLASLGELTAGIAHEIQNPLNFVNNFSEVSVELIDEMEKELAIGDKAAAVSIAEDVKENLQKIIQHGRRADSIVKDMLQHSRASSGEKQLTDINALAEEYLRLAYHGLRAKDKEFNATLQTDFDKQLQPVAVVPQELGRVFLNLFNNAFYAIQQKKNQLNGQYKPEVKVSTSQRDDKIEICVRDNGSGIPDNIKNKIFQPFFTTKPTGQGTGLGLSLSYDIITKRHGGEMKVQTKEGEGAEFIISLPNQVNQANQLQGA